MAFNPFAVSRSGERITDEPDYAVMQTNEYAAPPLERGDAYNDEFGWAPSLKSASAVEYPSAQRLGTIPRVDMRPDPVRAPDEWYGKRDADDARRHSVEDQTATGYQARSGVNAGDKRWADNPRSTPPPENRWTQRQSPASYSFTRPFDQGYARTLNGTHFSMADHRRDYEILGMAPVRTWRNTYRIEPQPWDTDIVDLPPAQADNVNAQTRQLDMPFGNRNWRL